MTASEEAKKAGLKSLAEVSRLTKVSAQTLRNWHRDKPELFNVVLLGCCDGVELSSAELPTNIGYYRDIKLFCAQLESTKRVKDELR